MLEKYQQRGFTVLAINVEPAQREQVLPLLAAMRVGFVPLDSSWDWAEKHYEVQGTPATALIDPQGRIMFRPERFEGPPLVVQFELSGEPIHVRMADGAIETTVGPAANPDVVIAGDVATLSRAAHDREFAKEAAAKGKMRTTGTKENVKRALYLLGLR